MFALSFKYPRGCAVIAYGVKAPWLSSAKADILSAMELPRSTDYFAAIPLVRVIGLFEPNKPTGKGTFWQHAEADIFLIAMVVTTAIAVATLVVSYSR